MVPIVFVFHADIAHESLALQFRQDRSHVGLAGSKWHIMLAGAHCRSFLPVHADDMSLENPETFDDIEIAGLPVTDVGTRPDAHVMVLDQGHNVVGVPNLVVRVIFPARMIMVAYPDIIFLHQFVDQVDGFGRLSGHRIEVHFLGELKNLASIGFIVGNSDDAIIHRLDPVLRQLGLDRGNDFVAGVMVPLHVALIGAERLTGEKLNHLGTRLSRLFDGLEDGKTIEAVGLAPDRKSADPIFIRDRRSVDYREIGDADGNGRHGKEWTQFHG